MALADQSTARHLLREIDDILLHGAGLGALDDDVSRLRDAGHLGVADRGRPERRRSVPPSCVCSPTCRPTSRSARSASGCSCPATRSARRSARSIESWASRHEATPCNRRRRSACSARSRRYPRLLLQGFVDVVPERHRELRSRGHDAREPDDGNDTDEHVDDLRRLRARVHRGIGLCSVGRLRAPDRDQRRRAGRAPASSDRAPRSSTLPVAAHSSPKRASLIASKRNTSV